MERTLIITGIGKLSVNPDLVIIRFPLETQNFNYAIAVDDLNRLVNLLRDMIEPLGLDRKELKTQDFRVVKDTKYNKTNGLYEFIGFTARHSLILEIPMDNSLTNKIITSIIKLDSRIEFKISFGIKDKESCLQSLIENAIKNAKEKATIIAKTSDVTLREILNINYSFSDILFHSDTDLFYDSDCNSEVCEKSMPDINPSDIEMNENITITWRIE